METIIEQINPRLKRPLSGLKQVLHIPKTAVLGFFTSNGVSVWFTEKRTYISTDNGFYKGIN